MLIICENHPDGSTPAKAVPAGTAWNRTGLQPTYVRFNGTSNLPAGVYFQRYQPMWELGRRDPFYMTQPLYLDDLVRETANADHPRDQS